jgi:hypothetical protein
MDVKWSYGARGAVVGATALAVAGFMWGGWVTGGSAEATALKRSQSAVVAVLTPICIEMPGQCRCFDEARGVEEHQRFVDAPGLHRERRMGDLRPGAALRTGGRLCRGAQQAVILGAARVVNT